MNKRVSQHATRHLLATCYIVVSVVTWTFSKGLKLVWRLPTITQLKLTLSPWTYIYWTDSSKSTWCLRSTKTIRLIRDGEKEGVWRWGRGRLYTYRYTVTTRMTSAWRWAAMRSILMFYNCEEQSHKTVSTDHNFWRQKRTEVALLTSLTPYRWARPAPKDYQQYTWCLTST